MRKLLHVLTGFVLLVSICVSAYAENDKAFIWAVTLDRDASNTDSINKGLSSKGIAKNISGESIKKPNTVYLMGSIHFADNSFYPLRKEIEQAFDRSDYLVVELDVNKVKPEVFNAIVREMGTYKNGKTIADVLSKETLLLLQQRLAALNIDYDAVKNHKPGILVLTLNAMQVAQMGFDPELGIDVYFLNRVVGGRLADDQAAKQTATQQNYKQRSNKRIIELETLKQQIDLFIDIPDGELLLKESLHSLAESDELMAEIVQIWKQGDTVKMNKLLFEDALEDYPEFSKIYDSLFYERNNRMVLKIDDMLKQQGDYFVVVGSGHLIGEKGIVSQLKNRGYRVKRL